MCNLTTFKDHRSIFSISKLEQINYNISHHTCKYGKKRFIILLIDALSRFSLKQYYDTTLEYLNELKTHYVYDFKNVQTSGLNSYPNKINIFGGRKFGENKTWLHDIARNNDFLTIHTDDIKTPKVEYGTLSSIMEHNPADIMMNTELLSSIHSDFKNAFYSLEFVANVISEHDKCQIFATLNPNHEHNPNKHLLEGDAWIKQFIEHTVNEDTVLVLLSDHGMHYGVNMLSANGRLHNTNPFLYFIIPRNFPEFIHSAMMRSVTSHMTTHADTYDTLYGLLSGKQVGLLDPNFNLLKTCKSERINSKYCRCSHIGDCSSQTKYEMTNKLNYILQKNNNTNVCEPLYSNKFNFVECTGENNESDAFHSVYKDQHNRYFRLAMDKNNFETQLDILSAYSNTIKGCETENVNKQLCICKKNKK